MKTSEVMSGKTGDGVPGGPWRGTKRSFGVFGLSFVDSFVDSLAWDFGSSRGWGWLHIGAGPGGTVRTGRPPGVEDR